MSARFIVSISLIGLLLCGMSFLVYAHDKAKHPKTGEPLRAESFRAEVPVKIDAKLDEWKWVVPAEIKYAEQINVGPDNWKDAKDASCKIYCMWDEDYIYMAAEVQDDELLADKTGGSMWQNDGLEIFFSPENEAIDPGDWPHPSHYQFGLTPSSPDGEPAQWCWCNCDGVTNQTTNYIEIASSISDPYTGYEIETSIKLDAVPLLAEKVEERSTVGYHLNLDDSDGEGEPDCQITWSGGDPHDDRMFGDVTFVGPAVVSPGGKAATTWGALKGRH